jgi:plastocyanin
MFLALALTLAHFVHAPGENRDLSGGPRANPDPPPFGAPDGPLVVYAAEAPLPHPVRRGRGRVIGRLEFARPRPPQPIVVYVRRDGGELREEETPPALVVRQKGARFDPPFAVVVAGQAVHFDNDEDREVDHNVYALGAESIDLGIFPRGESVSHEFRSEGEVSIHCSVHRFMDARLFVAPSRFFARLDGEESAFSLEDVPEGTYVLRTYQRARRFRDAETRVVVGAGKTTEIVLEMTR